MDTKEITISLEVFDRKNKLSILKKKKKKKKKRRGFPDPKRNPVRKKKGSYFIIWGDVPHFKT